MKKLKFEKYPNLSIVCNKCGYTISGSKDLKTICKHPVENQRYKVVVRNSKTGKRKSKNLDTRDLSVAIEEARKFTKIIESPIFKNNIVNAGIKPIRLVDCMAMYTDYLEGYNTPFHKKKNVTIDYVKETERNLRYFKNWLKDEAGINLDAFTVSDVNDKIIGGYYQFSEQLDISGPTFNRRFVILKAFYNYLIDIKNYDLVNNFKKINLKSEVSNTVPMPYSELKLLIPLITEKNGIQWYKSGARSLYKPYIVDAAILSAVTGRRLGEIVDIKYSDITYDEVNKIGYITVLDEKATKLTKSKTKKYVYPPITQQLFEFLKERDFDKKLNTDEYIIASSEKANRGTIRKNISKGFSHFAKQLDTDKHYTFKSLRKNYLTELYIFNGGDVRSISGHSSNGVIDAHYLEKQRISLDFSKRNFRI